MTLRLVLTRHAKSSWTDPSIDDHDRPLNKRGVKSARAVGKWLAKRGYRPDQALVSTSERTRQTWALIAKAFDMEPEATYNDTIYHAEPAVLLDALHKATAPCVMMIAHNPGIAFFAQGLVSGLPGDTRFERYPTAATAVIDFDAPDWTKIAWSTGTVSDLVFARDLI